MIPVNLWTNKPSDEYKRFWNLPGCTETKHKIAQSWQHPLCPDTNKENSENKSDASTFRHTCSVFPFSSLLNVYEIWWWIRDSSVGIVKTILRSGKQRKFVPISNRDKGAYSSTKGPGQWNTPGMVLIPGVKQLRREAKHSPPFSVVVKNAPSTLHLHGLHNDKFNVNIPDLVTRVSPLSVWKVYCACHCQYNPEHFLWKQITETSN
jgi:hypothetical protein